MQSGGRTAVFAFVIGGWMAVVLSAVSAGAPAARVVRGGVEAGAPAARCVRGGVEAGVPAARCVRGGVEARLVPAKRSLLDGLRRSFARFLVRKAGFEPAQSCDRQPSS